jgi:hypothetical protein
MKRKNPVKKGKMDPKSPAKAKASGELSEEQLERVAGGRKAGGVQQDFAVGTNTADATVDFLKLDYKY